MPDIAMCKLESCERKETCYRYTAKPSEYRQSYFVMETSTDADGVFSCEYYWPIQPTKETK